MNHKIVPVIRLNNSDMYHSVMFSMPLTTCINIAPVFFTIITTMHMNIPVLDCSNGKVVGFSWLHY